MVPSSPKVPCRTGKIMSTLMARSDARRVRVGSVWKGAREPPDFLGSGGTTTASPAASTAAAGVVSGSPARRWRASCSGVLPVSNFSASAEVSQRPSLVMPIGTTSYLLLSIAPRTDAAERRETSCSPLRPPKRMPTRSFFMTLVWTRVSLASISRYDLSDLQKKKEYVMTVPFTMMNPREALATLGSVGLGLLAMHFSPVHTSSGKLYVGANIEFPCHSLGFSVHGEQSALSNAYMHSDGGVSSIAVTAAPCGHCRQFMNELSPDGDIQVLVDGKPSVKLSSLLPSAFGPKDLRVTNVAFPVKEVDLILPKEASDALVLAALAAARKSYAPYTKAYSGVAIGTRLGRTYKGAYI